MTGNELVKEIRKSRGKVLVPMLWPNEVKYVVAEKADLIQTFQSFGDDETGMEFTVQDGQNYIDRDYSVEV